MKSIEPLGVDAPFEDAKTPFVSEVAKIFKAAEKEAAPEELKRGGTLLTPPDLSHLGPERGRLDRLYAQYAAAPTNENLNTLLEEVERYARRNTIGKGGAFAQYVSQSVTDYAPTRVSVEITAKVWRNLDKFDGRSKFSVWVFRISRNVVKDMCRSIIARKELTLHEWKDYDNEGTGCYRGAPDESANSDFEVTGGTKTALPTGLAPDKRAVKLDALLAELNDRDRTIIYFVQKGYKPAEIGEEFGKDAKWASNQLNRIKKQLRKLAKEPYPKAEVAKSGSSSVLVMKGDKPFPASRCA